MASTKMAQAPMVLAAVTKKNGKGSKWDSKKNGAGSEHKEKEDEHISESGVEANENGNGSDEDKLFKCVPCNKSYGLNKNLNKHMRLKHPEQWAKQEKEK